MVKSIYLQDGEEIFVDDEDYERVNQYNWYVSVAENARIIQTRAEGTTKKLPNFILKKKFSFQKIKNNDFTRGNLEFEGKSQRYSRPRRTGSSKYKGVSWSKNMDKWLATIRTEGKQKYLGVSSNEDNAGKIYNDAVDYYWNGEGYKNLIGIDNRGVFYEKEDKDYQRRKKRGSKNKYRGVFNAKRSNTHRIQISKKYIGSYKDENKAALIYNKCAIYLHGDDAILNDVPITDELKDFIANWEIPDKIKALKEGATSE